MSEPVPIAVVGAGAMGRLHARTVAAHPGARLVAVVDRCARRGVEVGGAFGATGRLEDAALVIVATPATAHAEVARALLPGRWCLVEKPLAPTASEAATLLHPRCLVGHSERFAAPVGRGATPARIDAVRRVPAGPRGRDVDALADLLVHDLDRLLWCVGAVPTELDATALRWEDGRIEHAVVTLGWPGGHARLEVERGGSPLRRWSEDGAEVPSRGGPPDPLTRQLEAALACMHGEASPIATAAQALQTLTLCDRIRACIVDARPLSA